MTNYEEHYTSTKAEDIAICRLDGHNWGSITKKLPHFSKQLDDLVALLTKSMMYRFTATYGFCGSDEISLVFVKKTERSELPFGGKYHKLNSLLAAYASSWITLYQEIEELKGLIMFDCRTYEVPTLQEAINELYERQKSVNTNFINGLARQHFSHERVQGLSVTSLIIMLESAGVDIETYPSSAYQGHLFKTSIKERSFTAEEIEKLPLRHRARTDPSLKVERNIVEEVNVL